MGNKSGGFRRLKKTGGELNSNDIEKINELITNKLVHFGLIPAIEPTTIDTGAKESSTIETEAKESSTIEPGAKESSAIEDAASIEAAMVTSIKVNNTGNIPNAVFAKSTIPLSSGDGASDVYFHMVKITEENIERWKQFEKTIKEITPPQLINKDWKSTMQRPDSAGLSDTIAVHTKIIDLIAGIDHFKVRASNAISDLFVVYASKELNKTNFPPDWKDVEIMVTVIAKEGVPFVTQMGIVKLAHTYTKGAFKDLIDKNKINKDLFDYLDSINFSYPSHSRISLYLFTFIGTHIYQFFSTKKIALFTSPTEIISSIVTNTLKHKYKLPYGYEKKPSFRDSPNYIIKLNLYYSPYEFLILTKDILKELCPWYCNIFRTIRVQNSFPGDRYYDTEDESNNFADEFPEDTEDCYTIIGISYVDPFLYVPIYSFNQLVDRGIYQFEPIE